MTKYIVFLVFILTSPRSYCQYNSNQNKVWVFGHKAALDFNSGHPVSIFSGLITEEGSASVCDSTGQLLFYTNGATIWDRANVQFGNIQFYNTNSSSQAALIVPAIGNADRYFVFGIQEIEYFNWYGDTLAPRQYMGIVDMSLNGGMGGLVPGSTKLLAEKVSEKQIAIRGSSNDIWLLTHCRDTAIFYSYHITAMGIDTVPVVSAFAGRACGWGVMKSSHDDKTIVVQHNMILPSPLLTGQGIELYDFNTVTGKVSNSRRVVTGRNEYGAEFSPDNSKLYTMSNGSGGGSVYQYDITSGNAAAIKASETFITSVLSYTDLKLGPDGKIYMTNLDSSGLYLDRIVNPNAAGTSCNYVPFAVRLLDGASGRKGLPNLVVSVTPHYTGVDALRKDVHFKIYPDPVTTDIVVEAETNNSSRIYIIDLLGRPVMDVRLNGKKTIVNVRSLLAGYYFAVLNDGNRVTTHRFEKL